MVKYLFGCLLLSIVSCSVQSPTSQSLVATESLAPQTGRYRLISPAHYQRLVVRAEKFFTLLPEDTTLLTTKFQSTTLDPANIISAVRASTDYTVIVETYRPAWPWSAAIASYSKGIISLNNRKLLRSDCTIINTLVHEYMHHLGFTHGDNYAKGKDFTVPYWMGNRAETYCMKGLI